MEESQIHYAKRKKLDKKTYDSFCKKSQKKQNESREIENRPVVAWGLGVGKG